MDNKDSNGSEALLIILVGLFLFWAYCVGLGIDMLRHMLGFQ